MWVKTWLKYIIQDLKVFKTSSRLLYMDGRVCGALSCRCSKIKQVLDPFMNEFFVMTGFGLPFKRDFVQLGENYSPMLIHLE